MITWPTIRIPIRLVEWLCERRLIRRPRLLCVDVAEGPLDAEIRSDLLYREVRKSYPKWAHLACPRCGEHIQLPIAASPNNWTLRIDWLHRPTLHPSVWETASCRAHFLIRRGELVWCPD